MEWESVLALLQSSWVVGEMGHIEEPGVFNTPDPRWSMCAFAGDQIKGAHRSFNELRMTNELEEALFVDRCAN
jgi:hypothetical protein